MAFAWPKFTQSPTYRFHDIFSSCASFYVSKSRISVSIGSQFRKYGHLFVASYSKIRSFTLTFLIFSFEWIPFQIAFDLMKNYFTVACTLIFSSKTVSKSNIQFLVYLPYQCHCNTEFKWRTLKKIQLTIIARRLWHHPEISYIWSFFFSSLLCKEWVEFQNS